MFMQNATDLVLRIRQHPSIMLYCGRNEGYPPKALDDSLRQLVSELTAPSAEALSHRAFTLSSISPVRPTMA